MKGTGKKKKATTGRRDVVGDGGHRTSLGEEGSPKEGKLYRH